MVYMCVCVCVNVRVSVCDHHIICYIIITSFIHFPVISYVTTDTKDTLRFTMAISCGLCHYGCERHVKHSL